jgi:hypothetical protein
MNYCILKRADNSEENWGDGFMGKSAEEKLWDTINFEFSEGDRITFHNTEQGVEKTYTVKCIKDNGDIELVYTSAKQYTPIQ